MRYEFTDLASGEALPDDHTVSALELVREHQQRWVYHTSKGDIVFRRLPLRMQRVITMEREANRPKVAKLLKELEELRPFFDGLPEEEVDADVKSRAMTIVHTLMLTDLSPLGVITVPVLQTMEDYDALLEMLTPEEVNTVQRTVTEMASVTPASRIDSTALEIADKLGINVVPDDMVHFLTVSQADYYIDRINQERVAIDRMRRQMGGMR